MLVGCKLTVTKAHLTVTADAQAKTYGDDNPPLTATVSGFVNGENLGTSGVSGSASCVTTAVKGSPVNGSTGYPITCSVGGLSAGNYDFPAGNFVAGKLTVKKAHLTVAADAQTDTFGDDFPGFT